MEHEWTNCYRMRPSFRNVGIIGTVFCAVCGLTSIFVAYFNVDGSIAHPELAALFMGLGWSAFTLLGVWLLLLYYKYRLFVGKLSLRQKGVLLDRRVDLNLVEELEWRQFPQGGSVRLSGMFGVLKIGFGNFSTVDRKSLVAFLRHAISETRQTGWQEFNEQYSDTPENKRRAARLRYVFMIFFIAHSVGFGIMGAIGAGVLYFVLSGINAIIVMRLLWLSRRKESSS